MDNSEINQEPMEELEIIQGGLENLSEKYIKEENAEFLQKLTLQKNRFIEIPDNFINFSNLVYLDMTENYLENITNLYYLNNLEVLILSKNFINNIGNVLTSLQKLQFLDLCYNKLDIDDMLIKTISQNTNLFSLSLRGNDNYDFEKVRIKCLEYTKNLEILDTITIFTSNKKSENLIFNSTVDVKSKKGERVKVKTLKDYMDFKIRDYEENEDSYTENSNSNTNNYDSNFNSNLNKKSKTKDSYIENLLAKNKKSINPKSFYYYSNSVNFAKK